MYIVELTGRYFKALSHVCYILEGSHKWNGYHTGT